MFIKEEAEYDGKILSNDDIVNKVISYSRISNTNNIYVYMGTYQRGSYSDIEHGPTDKRVARDNENADYRVYADIEKNSSDAYVEVPIEKCDDFEKENTILFSHQFISSDYYYSVKKMFFEEALKNGQEKAIQKVLSIR